MLDVLGCMLGYNSSESTRQHTGCGSADRDSCNARDGCDMFVGNIMAVCLRTFITFIMMFSPIDIAVQVVDSFSSKSLRLMAVAVGSIPDAHALDFSQMVRHDIESAAINLELLCLVVLTNSVREDSQRTIREVQERYGVMPDRVLSSVDMLSPACACTRLLLSPVGSCPALEALLKCLRLHKMHSVCAC